MYVCLPCTVWNNFPLIRSSWSRKECKRDFRKKIQKRIQSFKAHIHYRVTHLRNSFFKGPKILGNQYVDKKIRQLHNHKASPFELQPLEWILNAEVGLHHSLKFLVVAVLRSPKNAQFQTSVLTCWRLSSKFKIHSKGCKSNGEALWLWYCLIFLSTYWFSDIFSPFKKHILRWNTLYHH